MKASLDPKRAHELQCILLKVIADHMQGGDVGSADAILLDINSNSMSRMMEAFGAAFSVAIQARLQLQMAGVPPEVLNSIEDQAERIAIGQHDELKTMESDMRRSKGPAA